MFKTMKELFTSGNKDLRHRIYFTLAALAVFTLGIAIRVPGTEDLNELKEKYIADIRIYANNRTGLIVDVSKALTERKIDVKSMNCRTGKSGTATLEIGFEITGIEQLQELTGKLRSIDGVIDIERTTG